MPNFVVGYSHPRGTPDTENGLRMTEGELRRRCQQMVGLPVLGRHMSDEEGALSHEAARRAVADQSLGKVVQARVMADGRLRFIMALDDSQEAGEVWADVQAGRRAGLSLGIQHLQDSRTLEKLGNIGLA